ncbi:MAG: tRNA threonylcarbamoyladenosine dehydratase [Spirochaetia bacterium]|nr:tRNA threonylcarbamoyladenosine dehydratase [Spirochaetia bacterium]
MSYPQFSRTHRLIGEKKFKTLQDSHIIIVGLGAVGSYALEALARSGIETFTLVDFDTVGITNINRQLFALNSTIGELKVDVAKKRILDINSKCNVRVFPLFAQEETFDEICSERSDFLIDAIDSLNPKVALLEYAYTHNIRCISSMGAALKKEATNIQIADLMDTHTCSLAKTVRNRLKRRGVGRGIDAVFSSEKVEYEYKEANEEIEPSLNEQLLEKGRERRVLGSLSTVTGLFGLTLAHHVIKTLSN